jgi:adenosylmethionine-8-amino-7-oxononanoate aminotransferase
MKTASTTPRQSSEAALLAALDRRHIVHPHQTVARPGRQVFIRGSGCLVWDADGREYVDAMGGGNWLAQVGHARPELAEVAAAQIGQLEFFSCWREYANEPAIRLAAQLADLAPGDLNKVFFTCGGSDGTDTAIKVARRYHHDRGEPDRTWILGRQWGYHGCTLGSGAVTGFDDMQYGVGPVLPHIEKVSAPMPYRSEIYGGQDPTDFLIDELAQVIDRIGPGRTAAMIGEPIMGGAGVVIPPADYWPRVRALLSEHGILLIADEVITGYGRVGSWFVSGPYGADPDIIVSAKGLTSGYAPLGAVIMRDAIGEVIGGGDTHFFHGQTYFGHPVSCALALANLNLLEKENLLGQARSIGGWFRDGLRVAAELPAVGDIRIEGAMVGVELVTDKCSKEPMPFEAVVQVVDELKDRHRILVRDYGPTLVLGPPLVLSQAQTGQISNALTEVLSRLDCQGQLAPR